MKLELDKAREDGAKKWGIPKFPPTLDELLRETQAKTLEIAAKRARAKAKECRNEIPKLGDMAPATVHHLAGAATGCERLADEFEAAAAALREGR